MIAHPAILFSIVAAIFIAAATACLFFGRSISLFAAYFFPSQPIPKPVDRLLIQFDSAGISSRFTIGQENRPLSWPHFPGKCELKVHIDRQNRLILRADQHSFTLGPIQTMWNDPTRPEYQFVPEPGDALSFTRTLAPFPWPTPFTYNFLGGSVPKWKRHIHDRLRWTKLSGAILEIVWHNEYWLYRRSGWADTCNNRLSEMHIRPSPTEKIAAAYLAKTRGWSSHEYRLEPQPPTNNDTIIAAIFLKDESTAHPGAGQSVILHINQSSRKIVKETGWQ